MGSWFPVINAVLLLFLIYLVTRLSQAVTELRKNLEHVRSLVDKRPT